LSQRSGTDASAGTAPRPAISWLGHATTLIEVDGTRLVTDPVLGNRVGPLVRIAAPVAADALGAVNGVLLSHLHSDHADLRSLRAVGASAPVLAPRQAGSWLRRHGVMDVIELSPGASVRIGRLDVWGTPAAHGARRRPFGAIAHPIGYLVRGSVSLYFAGDTDLFDEMENLHGQVDVALLPVWGWGSRLGPGHLDPERAARAAALIAPRLAIPIHWGTLALGWPARRPEDPEQPAREFAALVRRDAPGVEVRVLAPGERVEL
jgi:L-ascorbate metabolism protein UlaG (beta-lactamase superfamily)